MAEEQSGINGSLAEMEGFGGRSGRNGGGTKKVICGHRSQGTKQVAALSGAVSIRTTSLLGTSRRRR